MIERILDISEKPANLRLRNGLLVMQGEGEEPVTMPLEDVAVLVVSNPQVTFSQAILSGIAASGGAFVVCDEKHMPVGMLLPLTGNFVQAERFALQANVPVPTRKRLWQQLVRAKIKAQANLLKRRRGNDEGLAAFAERVRSGDPENLEGQASRRYWRTLFADASFRRDAEAADQNRHLNYGYAVLRAIVARAICAAGLHPSLGLHHHNRYDAFCLADDLMEPLRPVVDAAVVQLVCNGGDHIELEREAKAFLLQALTGRATIAGESRTLFDVAARCASSLVDVFEGKQGRLLLPEV